VTYQQPKVVYAAPPVINRPTTESQKTESLSAMVTTISTIAANPSEEVMTLTKTTATAPTASTEPQHIASGIELNVPVEKIEAEKKSTVITASQPPSTATAPVEVREPPSTQTSVKKEKQEKKRKFVRMAAGTVWEDKTLGDWDLGKRKDFLFHLSLVQLHIF